LRDNVARLMEEDGLELVGLSLDAQRAVIRVRNTRFQFESMALGRAMRILSITMPHSVEVFEVVFVVEGMDVSRVRMNRRDIEALEHAPDGADQVFARATIEDATRAGDPELIEIMEPQRRFTWGIAPYVETVLFDPSAPVRGDIGLRANARYTFGRGFVAEGGCGRGWSAISTKAGRWTGRSPAPRPPSPSAPTPISTIVKATHASSA
jgi:hypothetical protein